MSELKKLDRWAEKLLDTGKRNNLINFKDTKNTTAKVLYPDTEGIFSKCAVGRVFDVFDPKIREADTDDDGDAGAADLDRSLSQEEYFSRYSSKIKNEKTLLMYARTPNPITAVKTIAKKAKELQDETGINVAYLAFGFVKWTEKEGSEVVYRAPLLLVHVNVITGSIVDPVRIEISDDDVVINPTFNYLLQADYGITLPELEDGEILTEYLSHIQQMVRSLKWDVLNECALGIFSFLKINMYEDLKQNASQVLENKNVKALLGEDPDNQFIQAGEDEAHAVKNPLIDLHTVVDADSSQMEAIMMAKSGKSFVLQGPPGTGKSQTITNIIAECLHDGKKVLFVSEKQAALNVVYDKLKKANLSDYCLELHSHKANKRALIDELNRTLELPRTEVDASATDEIRQKQEAQTKLDGYAEALHEVRKPIEQAFVTIDTPHMYRMIIVGGSGLVLLETITRATQDIDAIDASVEIRGLLEKYGANLHVSAYMNHFPYNFEDRLHKLPVGGRKILFYSASLEDIVVAKLFSIRPKDRQDLVSDEVLSHINWDVLQYLATDENEVKASALNERAYQDFLHDYYEYVGRYGPHESADI